MTEQDYYERRYQRIRLASLLPYPILKRLARRFDTPGAFTCDVDGSSFWMDASYWRWVRHDKRRER